MSDYIIDFQNLTVQNAESNGSKVIESVKNCHGRVYHLYYINCDNRIWAQAITLDEYVALEMALVEAPYTASELGLGKGLLL